MDFEELDRLRKSMESLRSGSFTAEVNPEDSIGGKQLAELQKLRNEFDKYRADEATYRTEQDRILHAERRRNTVVSAITGLLTASLANLFIYYWPSIVFFASGLFQRVPPP